MFNLLTILLSGLISLVIADIKAKSEIKKIKIPIDYEVQKMFNEAFSNCMSATETYLNNPVQLRHTEALTAVNYLLAVAPAELYQPLIELDKALCNKDKAQIKLIRSQILELFTETVQDTH